MKVVLDTNVLLLALATHGICEALLDACVDKSDLTIVLSEHILQEFSRQYQDQFGMSAEQAGFVVQFLRSITQLVEPVSVPPDTCRDQDDLSVLGTAKAAQADCLVTGDKDLLVIGRFHSIPILTPRAFYERLR